MMFVVRNLVFSWFFLTVYIALSIQMFFQARSVYLGTYRIPAWADPLVNSGFFFFLSLICLAIYVVFALIDFAASQFGSRR